MKEKLAVLETLLGEQKFLAGDFAGAYETALIAEFDKLLPSTPPWKR